MGSCGQKHYVGQLAELQVEVGAGELPVDGLGAASHGGFEGQDSVGQLSERPALGQSLSNHQAEPSMLLIAVASTVASGRG